MGAQGRWAFPLLPVWNLGGCAPIPVQRHVGVGEPSVVAGRCSKRAGPGFLGSFNTSAAWKGPRDSLGCPTSVQQVTKGLLGASGCEGPSLARDEAEIPPDLGDLHGDLVTSDSPQAQTFGP